MRYLLQPRNTLRDRCRRCEGRSSVAPGCRRNGGRMTQAERGAALHSRSGSRSAGQGRPHSRADRSRLVVAAALTESAHARLGVRVCASRLHAMGARQMYSENMTPIFRCGVPLFFAPHSVRQAWRVGVGCAAGRERQRVFLHTFAKHPVAPLWEVCVARPLPPHPKAGSQVSVQNTAYGCCFVHTTRSRNGGDLHATAFPT